MIRIATATLLAVALMLGVARTNALENADVAVIFSERDPRSHELARRYAALKAIPENQVQGVNFAPQGSTISRQAFDQAYAALLARLPSNVQAFALMWTRPFRVDCMSVTSAFAFGFDEKYCAKGCQPTAANPYYGSVAVKPFDSLGLRPAMLVTAGSYTETLALFRRTSKAALRSAAGLTALLVTTKDRARRTRSPRYQLVEQLFGKRLDVRIMESEGAAGYANVMFYFIGAIAVPNLAQNTFAPGAMGDHLTSAGGNFDSQTQMSALEWIRAGTSGSYGTVVEPCNFPQKFPDPAIAMGHYLNGDALIEAYWKSVLWPGQGVFVGDPLARPFAKPRAPQ